MAEALPSILPMVIHIGRAGSAGEQSDFKCDSCQARPRDRTPSVTSASGRLGPLFLRTFLLKRPDRGMGRCTQMDRRSFSSLWLAEPRAEIVVAFGVWTRNILRARMILFCEEMEV
jgi:hypothetical protein